ncbi:YuzF family protein [Bacillus alkalicellulosilyticus]|uniref:YuzF family protein n=1 Tax=Alkalihalobacterium alkalicellulosilyticum TaxID=1912214 RepID=UPI000997E1DA|nr:YuzF family protein [Bacillus alkalicellulosilyticus]
MVSLVDPYVYQTLQTLAGRHVVVQTPQGNVRGNICDVKPDHVVVESHGANFFIRIQHITWVMPY